MLKMNYKRAMNIILKGYKEQSKDKLFLKWLIFNGKLKDDYRKSFNKYLKAHEPPKKIDKNYLKESKNKIDKETERIMKKFRKEV